MSPRNTSPLTRTSRASTVQAIGCENYSALGSTCAIPTQCCSSPPEVRRSFGNRNGSSTHRSDFSSRSGTKHEIAQPDAPHGNTPMVIRMPPASSRLATCINSPRSHCRLSSPPLSSRSTAATITAATIPMDISSSNVSLGGNVGSKCPSLTRSLSCDNMSQVTNLLNSGKHLDEICTSKGSDPDTVGKTFEIHSSLLEKILEIISQLKISQKQDVETLKANFDSKLGAIEKNLTESAQLQLSSLQTNFDSRLCAFEKSGQEYAEMSVRISNRLIAIEERLASLPEFCELIQQLRIDQKDDVANVKTNVENRLRDLEEHIGSIFSQEIHEAIYKHKQEQNKDITSLRMMLQDRVTVTHRTMIGHVVTPVRGDTLQHEHDRERDVAIPQGTADNIEHRMRVAEDNIDLITSILKGMEAKLPPVDGEVPECEATENMLLKSNENDTNINYIEVSQQACESSCVIHPAKDALEFCQYDAAHVVDKAPNDQPQGVQSCAAHARKQQETE